MLRTFVLLLSFIWSSTSMAATDFLTLCARGDANLNKLSRAILRNEGKKIKALSTENCIDAWDILSQKVYLDVVGNEASSEDTPTDIEFVKFLPKVEYLTLVNTRVKDITPIQRLKRLRHLTLVNNGIKDFYPIKRHPKLRGFSIVGEKLFTPETLYQITSDKNRFTIIDLQQMSFNKPLRVHLAPDLEALWLNRMSIDGIKFDTTPKELKHIVMTETLLKDLHFLENAPALEEFSFLNSRLKWHSIFNPSPKLKMVMLGGSHIDNFIFNQPNHNLESLDLRQSNVKSLNFLQLLPELKHLNVSETKVQDFSPLLYTKVDSLVIDNMKIDNLDFLQYTPDLTRLSIRGNYIDKLRPLMRMSHADLLTVDAGDNPITGSNCMLQLEYAPKNLQQTCIGLPIN